MSWFGAMIQAGMFIVSQYHQMANMLHQGQVITVARSASLTEVNYKSVQRITLDSSGKGTATFNTYGLAAGTYKFYIRDTSGTWNPDTGIDELKLAEDLYTLDPAEPVARLYNAHDDLIVTRTIELLETAPTTTTPTPTTPTPTPAEGGGIPGFEAVFAIAGLLAVAYLLRRRE